MENYTSMSNRRRYRFDNNLEMSLGEIGYAWCERKHTPEIDRTPTVERKYRRLIYYNKQISV